MSGSLRPPVRPRTALLVASLATAPALLLGTAALAGTTATGEGCGVVVEVPVEVSSARVAVSTLPELTPVAVADDGVLSGRGAVEVRLDAAEVASERVRVVLTLDGTEQAPVDVDVPQCADGAPAEPGASAGPTVGPTTGPGASPTATPTATIEPPAPSAPATATVGTVSPPAGPVPAPRRPQPVTLPPAGAPAGAGTSGVVPLSGSTGAAASLPVPVIAGGSAALAPLVAPLSGAAALALPAPQVAPPAARDTGISSALPVLPGPVTVLTSPASGLPSSAAVPEYADLVPAAVLLSGSLGGLVAFARRRWI